MKSANEPDPQHLITVPGIFTNISAKAYHADPCPTPSLSATISKVLVAQSPRHAWLKHPRLGGAKPADAEEVDEKTFKDKEMGTLLHRLMLGAGGDIVVCPFDSWRKDAAKDMRIAEKAKGNIPVLQPLLDTATAAYKEARKQLDDMGLDYVFRDGLKECVIAWKEGDTWLRAMLDNLIIDEQRGTAEIWDLKSVGRSAHPKACAAQIHGLGYDLGAAFYKQGLNAVRPDLTGRVKFKWAFMEVKPPNAVTPVDLDGEWDTIALSHYSRAVDGWKRCMAANQWPTYTDKLITLSPEPWMLAQAIGADEIAANVA